MLPVNEVRHKEGRVPAFGVYRLKAKGGYLQFRHPLKKGRVTVSGYPGDDIHPKTLRKHS